MGVYADLLAAARGFYARREGDDWAATFSAGMLLALLLILNISTGVMAVDALTSSDFYIATWVTSHKLHLLPVVVAVGVVHVLLAARQVGMDSEANRRKLRSYIVGSAVWLLLGLFVIAVVAR